MRTIGFGALILAIASALAAGEPGEPDDYVARMEREHATDEPVATPGAEVEPAAPVEAEDVVYAGIQGVDVTGYLARPVAGKPSAGIIVIHEWWGLNDNIRSITRRLAGEGYVALAVDLYEGEVAATREQAARLARASREQAGRLEQNLHQAWRYLEEEQGLPTIGVIGWCFGGGWSLQAALMLGDGIDATVVYYGRVPTSSKELEPLRSPLLGIFGSQDQGIPVATVREFQASLDALGKTATIHIYEGADHAFANPSGRRYNEGAAADAWGKTLAFFARHLQSLHPSG